MTQDLPRTSREMLGVDGLERAHDFLAALFMAVRTAQIHDSSNAAFRSALERTTRAAENLHAAVGGFQVQTAHGSLFVNQALLRFSGGSYDAMQKLQNLLIDRELGGFSIKNRPTHGSILRLVTFLARGANLEGSEREALLGVDIKLLGPQQVGSADPVSVNRNLFAVHTYAKLALAYREHSAIAAHRLTSPASHPAPAPRIRVARVVQDLIELARERLDLLLYLTLNRRGLQFEELYAVNGAVMGVALGSSLGIHRKDLMDIAMVTFFLPFGNRLAPGEGLPEAARHGAVLAYLIQAGGSGPSSYERAMMTSEQLSPQRDLSGARRRPHVYSRLVRVATAFARLISGYESESGRPPPPLHVLKALMNDESGWLDPQLVDLAVNLLRAFPTDCPVILKSGVTGTVDRPNRERWDRPEVVLPDGVRVDLNRRQDGQFRERIVATPRFLGIRAPPIATPRPKSPQPFVASRSTGLPSLTDLARSGPVSPPQEGAQRGVAASLVDDLLLGPNETPPSLLPPTPPARLRAEPMSRGPGSDRLVGTYLAGRYRLLRKLGEGGMGAVYLARQEPIDRDVAVKILLGGLVKDRMAVARFEREAKTISKMRNPNTVTVYDYGKTKAGELYIVMEYLAGQTLAEVIQCEAPLPARRAVRIARQVCSALAEAHDLGVVHRDLKPDNIILTQVAGVEDWVKVLDFGLAKLVDNEHAAGITQHGRIFGTPRYMSPEQAQDFALDGRSDLYALGIVLYEMLTGQTPFRADNMVGVLMKHVTEPPRPPSKVGSGIQIDSALETLVLQMLAKDPARRFQNVRAVSAALQPFAEKPTKGQDVPDELGKLIEEAMRELTPYPDTDEPMEL